MKVEFCRVCGRITLRGFVYCPYCGMAIHPGPGIEEAFASFDRLERMQTETRLRHIEELLLTLDGIESDIDTILNERVSSVG